MAKVAKVLKRFNSGQAIIIPSWQEQFNDLTLITDIDAGNVSPTLSSVVNPSTQSPIVNVWVRYTGYRHFHFAVENAEGKTPHFVVDRSRREVSTLISTHIPVYTTDFITWNQVTNKQNIGGTSGTIEFDTPALPAGRIYFATAPLGRYLDCGLFVQDMLTNHASISSPTLSGNASCIYNTTPAETDDLGRVVGGNSQYAIKLFWGGLTTDGKRKRKLVVLTHIHSGGEAQSWTCFLDSVDWMLNSSTSEAVAFRSNWDVYIYMPVTANGLKGGSYRTNFRSSVDPNRDFYLTGSSALQEITALRAAIETDVGGSCDLFYSWHAFHVYSDNYIVGVATRDANVGTRSLAASTMMNYGTTLFGASPNIQTSGTNNTDCWWGITKLGAKAGFDAEVHGSGNTLRSNYTTIAHNWMKMAVHADSLGLFVEDISTSFASSATITASIDTQINISSNFICQAFITSLLSVGNDLSAYLQSSAIISATILSGSYIQSSFYVNSELSASLYSSIDLSINLASTSIITARFKVNSTSAYNPKNTYCVIRNENIIIIN